MLSRAVWTACMASTQVTAAECSCLPMLVLGRFDCRENAGQNAAREKHAGDLQMVSASIWCSAGGQCLTRLQSKRIFCWVLLCRGAG